MSTQQYGVPASRSTVDAISSVVNLAEETIAGAGLSTHITAYNKILKPAEYSLVYSANHQELFRG